MNVENLRNNHPKLISYMESAGYSNDYIGRILKEIQWIMTEAEDRGWESYSDISRYYEAIPMSSGNLEKKMRDYRCHQRIRSS